jgi:uncharacterized protein Usg
VLIKTLVLVDVIYYRPDYTHLLNEFIWQTPDIVPEIPRVHKFLKYWQENIDAKIQEVLVSHAYQNEWRTIELFVKSPM